MLALRRLMGRRGMIFSDMGLGVGVWVRRKFYVCTGGDGLLVMAWCLGLGRAFVRALARA
jgi:hypothetical protein